MAEIIVVGLFQDRFAAQRAGERLVSALGTDPEKVALHGPGEDGAVPLSRISLPWEDHAFFREGMRRNRVVLSAVVDDTEGNRVAEMLEESGAMDLDQHEAALRQEGWAPPAAPTGYTGHDEDIGFATYGSDAVIRPIPKRHMDDTPAGLLGRWEQAAVARLPPARHRCTRHYGPLRS